MKIVKYYFVIQKVMKDATTGRQYSLETAAVHGGNQIDEATGAVNVPIYQTSTYKQDGLGRNRGFEYSRTGNPTRKVLEDLVADLEGGRHGFAFASGMAAINTVLSLFRSGDRILISRNVYGGTYRILDRVFSNFGFNYTILKSEDAADLERAFSPDVKALIIESPANPLMTVTDIRRFSDVAHAHGAVVIMDNTFMTPYLQRPLGLGADIVVHSGTKYLGGHSDLVAGLAVVNDDAIAERLAFLQNATGGILQPFDSFLLIRGIKTLPVRMDRHVSNAERIAGYLSSSPDVSKVYYPGLDSDPGHEICFKQARNGGAMLSFELSEGHDLDRFFESLNLISLAESLGGAESLICHPSSMTHASIPPEIRKTIGISEGLIRLSPGIEAVEDIIDDLEHALKESRR